MGAPTSGMKAAEQPPAEALLSAFRTIPAAERRRHASVLNYWLSIRGDKEFPPLHDLDPLELSDAGPNSILFELISGGHDAEIRHMGEALRNGDWPERIMDADNPSILACIAKKLPIVAISRDFLAFEDEFAVDSGKMRCWVTLLPLSAGGAWVDYVYALVSTDAAATKGSETAEVPAKKSKAPEPATEAEPEPEVSEEFQAVEEAELPEPETEPETAEHLGQAPDRDEPPADAARHVAKAAPGFSKLLDSLAGLTGFYGSQPVKVDPVVHAPLAAEEPPLDETVDEEPMVNEAIEDEPVEPEPEVEDVVAEEAQVAEQAAQPPVAEAEFVADEEPAVEASVPTSTNQPEMKAVEDPLQSKLAEVRAKADEVRQARLRATAALVEGVSAAYDFALDAEDAPEEYLRLVEAQGLKIQLRAPMKPVAKLAFEGLCDGATIGELEAVLAWALKQDLPRGTLAARIQDAGGIDQVLNGGGARPS